MTGFLSEVVDGALWVSIRPSKTYTPLRMSVQAPGYARLPTLVDKNAPPAEIRLDSVGRLWVKGLPSVEAFVERAVSHGSWLLRLVAAREQAFAGVRQQMLRLADLDFSKVDDAALRKLVQGEAQEWKRLHEVVFHLVLFNALVVDEIGDQFFQFLVAHVGNRLALKHISELYRTPYAQEARRRKTSFHEHTDLDVPIHRQPVPEAQTELGPVSGLEGEVVSALLSKPVEERECVWTQYAKLRLVAPVLVQLNDEQAYLWRSHGRIVMRFLQEYELRKRQALPDYRVAERTVDELLGDLARE